MRSNAPCTWPRAMEAEEEEEEEEDNGPAAIIGRMTILCARARPDVIVPL